MRARGCIGNLVYLGILSIIFAFSSYFWFTYFVHGRSLETPNFVGRTITEAKATGSDVGLVVIVDNSKDRHSERVPVGAVAWQNRPPGDSIKRRTRIYVGQSLGPLVLSVPDLTGQSARTAVLRFGQRNLKLGNISYVEDPAAKNVVGQDPPVGTVVPGQTAVSLLVAFPSPGREFVMPDVIDHQLDEARYALENHRLNVSSVRFESYPGIADGEIIRQFPLPGGPVSPGDAITLVVSKAGAGVPDTNPASPGGQPPTATVPPPAAAVPPATQTQTAVPAGPRT